MDIHKAINYQQNPTRRYPDLDVNVSIIRDDDSIKPSGFGCSYEYEATLEIKTTFTANDAQLNDAKKLAKRRMVHHLYAEIEGDILNALGDCRDYEAVREHLGRALDRIRGE